MEQFYSLGLVLVAGTALWVYWSLKSRLDFLEHEVRWLRSELERLKPTEIRSAYDGE